MSRLGAANAAAVRCMGGGGHGHTPDLPPFARLQPPTGRVPEEVELVWDDSVAPETCIDLDAPHVSTNEVLSSFAAAFLFFLGLYTAISLGDPVASNPVAPRSTVIPAATMDMIVGIVRADDDEGEEEEEEE